MLTKVPPNRTILQSRCYLSIIFLSVKEMEVSFEMIQKSRKGEGNERKEEKKTKRLFPPYGGSDKNGNSGNIKADLWCILFCGFL